MAGVNDRVVIVTGAGGGLGRADALLLAERGARVVVNDVGTDGHGRSTAEVVVDEIVSAGGSAIANGDDVSTPEGGSAIVDAALETFGRIDGVVNNAGILRDRTFHKMTFDEWDAVIRVHLYGTYNVTRAAFPLMREQGFGRVVVKTSPTGMFGRFGQTNYGAAKSGMVGLVHSLALEGAKYGVLANAVCPIAATAMTEGILTPEEMARFDPRFVASLVVHLCSEELTDTDRVIYGAAGLYSLLQVVHTPGVRFDTPPTIDDLATCWDEITDLTGAVPGEPPY